MGGDAKERIFEHLNNIKIPSIREFTSFALNNLPDYFWTLPSTTMRGPGHAHDELLVDHVDCCAKIANNVANQQFGKSWNQAQKDQLIAAMLLHDGWRCGMPGEELHITAEQAEKRGLGEEYVGRLTTSKDHPEHGYKMLFSLVHSYNGLKGNPNKISREEYLDMLLGVRYHYGPWTTGEAVEARKPVLTERYDSVIVQVHNIDYHQMLNSTYQYRKGL